jgi:hypothetical protein
MWQYDLCEVYIDNDDLEVCKVRAQPKLNYKV